MALCESRCLAFHAVRLTVHSWTHTKDVSHLLALFSQPQELTFDLGNLINEKYTSPFNATLQATFFQAENTIQQADIVLPVPARRLALNAKTSLQHPQSTVEGSIVLPQNIERAIFTISACGQMDEGAFIYRR